MKNTELNSKIGRLIILFSAIIVVLALAALIGTLVYRYDSISSGFGSESIGNLNENTRSLDDDASALETPESSVTDQISDVEELSVDDISDISEEVSEPSVNHGWVINNYGYTYVYGDAGYEQFNYKDTALKRYVKSLNSFASTAPEDARLFNMIVPVSSTFADIPRDVYTADGFYNLSQSSFVKKVESALDERIKDIAIVDQLEALYDAGEYVFFRTDRNWTSDGAYAAYTSFCLASGQSRYPLSNFQKSEYEGFLGGFYRATSSPDMADNPDKLVYYAPLTAMNVDITVYSSSAVFSSFRPGKTPAVTSADYSIFAGKTDAPYYEIRSQAPGGKSLLMIGDTSFAPLAVFLSSHYSTIDVINPSEYQGDFDSFIKNKDYDDVLTVCYSTNAVNGDYVPDFNKFIGAEHNG